MTERGDAHEASATQAPPPTRRGMVRFRDAFVRFGRPLLLFVPLLYVFAFLPRLGVMDEGDAAQAYLQAGEMIRDGRSMYEPLPPTGPHRIGNYYLYPPPLGALVSLLPPLSAGTFQALILALNIIGVWVFSWSLARLAQVPAWSGTLSCALLLMMIPGVMETIAIGNIDPIVFCMVGLGLVLPAGPAAAALVSGAALKVTPVWALGVLVTRGPRQAWIAAATTVAICLLIVALAVGPDGLVAESLLWARRIAPTLAQGQFEVLPITVEGVARSGWFVNGNISPAFLPVRLLVDQPPPFESIPGWARAYLSAVQFGVPAFVAFHTRKKPMRVQAAWVIFAATLASPIMRGGYLPVLLVLPAAAWPAWSRRRAAAKQRRSSRSREDL